MGMDRILLYDYERDKNLQPGEVILVFEDGNTKRVRESSKECEFKFCFPALADLLLASLELIAV